MNNYSSTDVDSAAEDAAPTTGVGCNNEKSLPMRSGKKINSVSALNDNTKETPFSSENEYGPEPEYPSFIKFIFILIGLSLAVFCMALDNTVLATAIPRIVEGFNSLGDVGWYASSYLLTMCAFQLAYGKLFTHYPVKFVFIVAIIIFEVGSFICGIAPSSVALIVGRAVAGLGGAGIISGAVLIIASSVPPVKRPTYTGIITGIYGIASVAGPPLGGFFADKVTWRWCFYFNLPFGALTLLFITLFVKSSPPAVKLANRSLMGQLRLFDLEGLFFFFPAVICILLALQWGGSEYPFSNWRIILLFCFFFFLIAIFVGIQFYKRDLATVPPRLLANRNVWAGALFSVLIGGSFFILIFYLPIYFQAVKHASATKSGLMNLPMLLAHVISTIISGVLISMIGYYNPFMFLSSILTTIGAGLLTTLTPYSSPAAWVGYQLLYGVGSGAGLQQPLIAVQAALSHADVPIGTAVIMFSSTFGGALFASVGNNIFANRLATNMRKVLPPQQSATFLTSSVSELQPTILRGPYAKFLPQILTQYSKALTQTWYASVAMSVLSFFVVFFLKWISIKGKNGPRTTSVAA